PPARRPPRCAPPGTPPSSCTATTSSSDEDAGQAVLINQAEARVLAEQVGQRLRAVGDDHAGGGQVGVVLPARSTGPDGPQPLDACVAVQVGAPVYGDGEIRQLPDQ